jgi:hypothetical protein
MRLRSPCTKCRSKLDRKSCSIQCDAVKRYAAIVAGALQADEIPHPPDPALLKVVVAKSKPVAKTARPRTTPEERAAICEMRRAGGTLKEIAAEFGRSQFTVQNAIKAAGLMARDMRRTVDTKTA